MCVLFHTLVPHSFLMLLYDDFLSRTHALPPRTRLIRPSLCLPHPPSQWHHLHFALGNIASPVIQRLEIPAFTLERAVSMGGGKISYSIIDNLGFVFFCFIFLLSIYLIVYGNISSFCRINRSTEEIVNLRKMDSCLEYARIFFTTQLQEDIFFDHSTCRPLVLHRDIHPKGCDGLR